VAGGQPSLYISRVLRSIAHDVLTPAVQIFASRAGAKWGNRAHIKSNLCNASTGLISLPPLRVVDAALRT
jgi:hypothetical protein